jgi:CRP/FNR family transcriptional regulator, anaerobic regulatory protein
MALPAIAAAPPTAHPAVLVSIRHLKTHCNSCSVREVCLPVGLEPDAVRQLDAMMTGQTRFKKGDTLYRAGERFTALYAIRLGSCKTTTLAEDGREQITGYHMPGDIIGMDGIGTERHACGAIALEDLQLCALPFDRLEDLARTIAPLQHNLHRFLSRDIARDQGMMIMLGTMRAEERLAAFLLNLADRYRRRGFSSTEFILRLTREEIGSYLGLKLETVSRLFSRFHEQGLVQVQGRSIKLLDPGALKRMIGHIC